MPRDVVLHGALLEGTGTQMDKPLNEIVTTVAAVGFGGTHGDRNHKQTNNQRESRAP